MLFYYAEGRHADPKKNRALASVMEEGKLKGVPNSTLLNAVKKIVSK